MNDRELPDAAARWGASLMTRVYAVSRGWFEVLGDLPQPAQRRMIEPQKPAIRRIPVALRIMVAL